MNSLFSLKFEIHSFWQVSTGRGGGAILDVITHRDADGFPCLPGRSVKGLVRDAVLRAENWGYIDDGTTNKWFGTRDQRAGSPTNPGCLYFSDATLVPDLLCYLQEQRRQQPQDNDIDLLVSGFFHSIYATAMENGTAKPKSLRSSEVVIPLELYAELEAPADWPSKELKTCLPLIQAVGGGNYRGLGRVTVTLEENANG